MRWPHRAGAWTASFLTSAFLSTTFLMTFFSYFNDRIPLSFCAAASLSVAGVATMCFRFVQFTAKAKGVEGGGGRHGGGELTASAWVQGRLR